VNARLLGENIVRGVAMRSARNVLRLAAMLGLAVSTPTPFAPQNVAAQSSEFTVLVAPLTLTGDVHQNFGKDVAKKVRDALMGFPGLVPIKEGDVNDLLKQYGLKAEDIGEIEWIQLGGRMSASLVMVGTAAPGGQGIQLDVAFVNPSTQDRLPVGAFSVPDRGKSEEAAEIITAGLGEQVEYIQSIAFCSEYLATEETEDAMRNCSRALEINPESVRAKYLRGRIHILTEAWQSAAEDLEVVVAAEPSNTEALNALAYTHAKLGNKDRSGLLYREYLNFSPNDVIVRLNIAYELAQAGAYPEAMAILQDGVQRAPDNADLLESLGSVALIAGQTGGEVTDPRAIQVAVEAFEKVLEIKGDQVAPSILTNVVNAYMLMEDYDEALAFSERALAMLRNAGSSSTGEENGDAPAMSRDEMLASLYSSRAQVYIRTDRYAQGAAELEKALELNPNIENGYQRVGMAKLQAGDSDGAIAAFRTAVERGAAPDVIADALFGQGYNDHFQQGRYLEAIALFDVAAEFAQAPETAQRIYFFIGYGHFQRGTALDNANQQAEACGPARTALSAFQQVTGPLSRAGSYEATNQAQIRDAVDIQLYRQEQIIKKAC